MAAKSKTTNKDPLADDEDELVEETEEEEDEVEAAPQPAPKARKADPRKAPGPVAGEFRWEDPSSLRQLDAKWILLWFVIPIATVIIYGLIVQN
jgi:hypothetical protein